MDERLQMIIWNIGKMNGEINAIVARLDGIRSDLLKLMEDLKSLVLQDLQEKESGKDND